MAISAPFISSTQVAASVPFDNAGIPYTATDVEAALTEIRNETVLNFQSTATTTNGSLTLVAPPTNYTAQFLTGSATGFTVNMPSATTLFNGIYYRLYNTSSQPITVNDGAGNTLFTLAQSSIGFVTLESNTTTAGTWINWQSTINNASGIVNYNIVSSTAFSTSSTSDVVITGFTVTPQAGTYAVWVNGSWTPQAGPVNLETVTIYRAGAAITDSIRSISPVQSLNPLLMCTQTIASVNGTQAIDVRINSSSGQNLTVNQRSLLLIRLGT
jgi:hypothetical protein